MAYNAGGALSPWLTRLFLTERTTDGPTLRSNVINETKRAQLIRATGITHEDGQELVWTEMSDGEYWIDCCIPKKVVDAFEAKKALPLGALSLDKAILRLSNLSFILARPLLPDHRSPSKRASHRTLKERGLCLKVGEMSYFGNGDGRVWAMDGSGRVGKFRKESGLEVMKWIGIVEGKVEGDGQAEVQEKVMYADELPSMPPLPRTTVLAARTNNLPLPPFASSDAKPPNTAARTRDSGNATSTTLNGFLAANPHPAATSSTSGTVPPQPRVRATIDWSLAPPYAPSAEREKVKKRIAQEKGKAVVANTSGVKEKRKGEELKAQGQPAGSAALKAVPPRKRRETDWNEAPPAQSTSNRRQTRAAPTARPALPVPTVQPSATHHRTLRSRSRQPSAGPAAPAPAVPSSPPPSSAAPPLRDALPAPPPRQPLRCADEEQEEAQEEDESMSQGPEVPLTSEAENGDEDEEEEGEDRDVTMVEVEVEGEVDQLDEDLVNEDGEGEGDYDTSLEEDAAVAALLGTQTQPSQSRPHRQPHPTPSTLPPSSSYASSSTASSAGSTVAAALLSRPASLPQVDLTSSFRRVPSSVSRVSAPRQTSSISGSQSQEQEQGQERKSRSQPHLRTAARHPAQPQEKDDLFSQTSTASSSNSISIVNISNAITLPPASQPSQAALGSADEEEGTPKPSPFLTNPSTLSTTITAPVIHPTGQSSLTSVSTTTHPQPFPTVPAFEPQQPLITPSASLRRIEEEGEETRPRTGSALRGRRRPRASLEAVRRGVEVERERTRSASISASPAIRRQPGEEAVHDNEEESSRAVGREAEGRVSPAVRGGEAEQRFQQAGEEGEEKKEKRGVRRPRDGVEDESNRTPITPLPPAPQPVAVIVDEAPTQLSANPQGTTANDPYALPTILALFTAARLDRRERLRGRRNGEREGRRDGGEWPQYLERWERWQEWKRGGAAEEGEPVA
ncbi:hypothetical protein JCM11641_005723 [Rhodosporidiobolus odoratus]